MKKFIFVFTLILTLFLSCFNVFAISPDFHDVYYNENTRSETWANTLNSNFSRQLEYGSSDVEKPNYEVIARCDSMANYSVCFYTTGWTYLVYLSDSTAELTFSRSGSYFYLTPSTGTISVRQAYYNYNNTTDSGFLWSYTCVSNIENSAVYVYYTDVEIHLPDRDISPLPVYSDEYEIYKNDNAMSFIYSVRATENSQPYGTYFKSFNYYMDIMFIDENNATVQIPFKWYRSYSPHIEGIKSVKPDFEVQGLYLWDYKMNRQDVYSQCYFSCLQLYSYSDGAFCILTVPDVSNTVPPDLNQLDITQSAENYRSIALWELADLPEVSLRQVYDWLLNNNYNYTFNDLYKGQFLCTITYMSNNTVAYQTYLNWNEYIDTGIAPPFDTEPYNLIEEYPWINGEEPPKVDPLTAPTPSYPLNYPNEITISDYSFTDYTPDSDVLEDIGYFFGIFLNDPHILMMIYVILGFYVCYVFLWG